MRLFGFEIKKSQEYEEPVSFAPTISDDGAVNIHSREGMAFGGSYGVSLEVDTAIQGETDLINRYRSMALQAEIQQGVEEITNASMTIDAFENIVDINLDDIEGLSTNTKNKITDEFEKILSLLNFPDNAFEVFQRWYVDGRLNFHVIIDEQNLRRGIIELRYIDPRKIKFIRETEDIATDMPGVFAKRLKREYYSFAGDASGGTYSNGAIIAKDSIVRVTSGIMNEDNTMVLSYLHKAIKPLNNLKMLEDSKIIYTYTRAAEKKVFYVDVGNLPKAKAEQYLYDMMARHKNKVVYDANTGEIKDDRKFTTMTEDYWFPRREGNRSTEIDVLAGAGSLTDNEDLNYFQKKLYKSLNVPTSRLEPETMYAFGRPSEMSRDEVKFNKFIKRLRAKFSTLFTKCLEKQLILKGIINPKDWEIIKPHIKYIFMKDNYFEEMGEIERLREKMGMLVDVDAQVGKYFSRDWVFKKVLFMSDEEIKEVKEKIDEERADGLYDEEMGGIDVAGDNEDQAENNPFGSKKPDDDQDEEEKEPPVKPAPKKREEKDDEQ